MRSSMAYFAGAGTVIAAIAIGVSGGFLISSIVSPHPEKHGSSEVTKLERRMSQEPGPAMNKGSPEPVPYLAAPQVSAAVAEFSAPVPAAPSQPQAPAQQASTQPAAQPAAPSPPAAQPVAAAEPVAREKAASEESFARVRDADLRRDARRAEEKRKAERRQQSSERRKWRPRDDDSELVEVERKVREETEPRQLFASEPARRETPRIRLFDME